MDKDFLQSLINKTKTHAINWQTTVFPFEFMVSLDSQTYIVSKFYGDVLLYEWNGDREIKVDFPQEDTLSCMELLNSLFDAILKSDNRINEKYLKHMNTKNNNDSKSISLYKVTQRLSIRKKIKIKEGRTKSFYYASTPNLPMSRYVDPPMLQIPTSVGMTDLFDAQVIFISAPGATGKTAMSEYLSNKLDIPILNLGEHDAVGADAISGVIMHCCENDDIFVYSNGLQTNTCSMLIDGLDEAAIKINQSSFEAFLKDVAFFAGNSQGLPFIIFGRSAVMTDAILFLEDKNVKVTHLQIEPFTICKAKEFIDKHIDANYRQKFEQNYKDVRDYIIEQLGGFFKNESEMNQKIYERFIGYAPVLLSITTLLKGQSDFHKLLDDLKQNKKQKIDLLVDVVERIIYREKGKIEDEVLKPILANRPKEIMDEVAKKAGDSDEQCARLLSYCLRNPLEIPISKEKIINEQYNEKINKWIEYHPFIDKAKRTFYNIVFESYVIAKLINNNNYRDTVLNYLKVTNSSSYLLLDIYVALTKDKGNEIDYNFFTYLYASFKSLDLPQDIGITEIICTSDDDYTNEDIECSVCFGRVESTGEDEYDFTFKINHDNEFILPSKLSAFTIDAPLKIKTNSQKTDIFSPSTICCSSFKMCSKDLLITKYDDSPIIIKCENFEGVCEDGNVPIITSRSSDKSIMWIITNDKVEYPFYDYKKGFNINEENEQISELYQKLRRMMLMFRSHSKGRLARCCSKIDSRIGKNPIGVKLINALKQKGVIYGDNIMYYINPDKQAEVLGLKYDDIRSSGMNEKIISFLETIKHN